MKARDFDPGKLDVEAFAKTGGILEGSWLMRHLERLAASTVVQSGSEAVVWRARGEHRAVRGGHPQVWLHIEAKASVML